MENFMSGRISGMKVELIMVVICVEENFGMACWEIYQQE
jgi:hypothetical protein